MSSNLPATVDVKKGVALIINNHTFYKKNKPNEEEESQRRDGSECDVIKLTKILATFGFDVRPDDLVVIDETKQKIQETVETLATELEVNEKMYDLVLVVVMTHGWQGGILTDRFSDIYFVHDIWEPFLRVKNMLKVFIFQACRGSYYDNGQEVLVPQLPQGVGVTYHQEQIGSHHSHQQPPTATQERKKVVKRERVEIIPNMPDVLVAYATIEALVSWRNDYGGHFITSFVNAMNEIYGKDGNVELTRLFKSTARLLAQRRIKVNGIEYKQSSSFVSSLTKKYFLVKPPAPPNAANT